MAFESTFKAIDNTLHHDDGCSTALDYVEQSSWVLFLKYFDDLEKTREQAAELEEKTYERIISGDYQWNQWAMPLDMKGNYDVKKAMVGDDLIDFVNQKLFPYLQDFTQKYEPDTIEYKVGIIFTNIKNKISSGYNLRDVIERIDELKFQTAENRHEMTQIYEDRLRQMGNAGRNGGEYYTPRPLIRTIVKSVNPKIGETVYDGACGSAGFLCEAYSYMHDKVTNAAEEETLQLRTFYGKELKGLAYIIAMMNMILHGVQSPNIIRTNTLTENLSNITPSEQKNVILANPPFGGSEREEVQQNFPIKSSETAYMFMQHFMRMLKAGGRAGIVIKNTFLSNGDAKLLRKKLLEECNLHTILDLPSGVFTGAGVKTVVLFFTKGEPTQKIWSDPDTREALFEKLEDAGYGKEVLKDIRKIIDAEKSDLLDVLEYIAYAITPIERWERAERINDYYESLTDAQKQFVDYLVRAYIRSGVDELSKDKLKTLLELKFGSVPEGISALGGVPIARQTFKDFQHHLYA